MGPFIADDPDIAAALLAAARAHWQAAGETTVVLDTPALHFRDSGEDADRLPGDHVLGALAPQREFLRMYQIIERECIADYIERRVARARDDADLPRWKTMFTRAARNRTATVDWMEKERDHLLPRIYSTTGPEKG